MVMSRVSLIPCRIYYLLTISEGLVGALSPTHLSVVQKGCDGKIKWNPLVYNMGEIGTSIQDSKRPHILFLFTS